MKSRHILPLLVLLLVAYGAWRLGSHRADELPPPAASAPADSAVSRSGDELVLDLFREQRSGVMVEVSGRVETLLPDDREGSAHQRFILRLAEGHTLLVSHNIDLAPRVPLARGDELELRGQYEWNQRGGVVHWTHHDPQGRREGGFIRHRGELYE